MNLLEFKEYQKTLPASSLRLDDLNPFTIREFIGSDNDYISSTEWISQFFSNNEWKIIDGYGVRHLMEQCFIRLKEQIKTIIVPEDVYPYYTTLAKPYFDHIISYATYPKIDFEKLNLTSAILIFTNPLTPAGKHISHLETKYLEQWLNEDSKRYLILDSCYNFQRSFIIDKIESNNVMELISISKLFLRNKEKGWLITRNKEIEFSNFPKDVQLERAYPTYLEQTFKLTWKRLTPFLNKINSSWNPPETSYLALIDAGYKELISKHNIAAIPYSVFGSRNAELSVLSILNLVKDELRR